MGEAPVPTPPFEPELGSRYGYGTSPITALADSLTTLALGVTRGEPPAASMVPLADVEAGAEQVKQGGHGVPDVERMAVVGFAMELDVSLRGRTDGRLRTVLWLGSSGVRLAKLRVAGFREGGRLPRPLAGLEAVAATVHSALAAGDGASLLFGEAERLDFDDDRMFEEAIDELPDDRMLGRAQVLAEGAAITGYSVDDAVVMLRGPGGGFWGLRMDFDRSDAGDVVVAANPVVTVRRLRHL